MTTDAVAIDTAPVDLRAAAAIEAAEARAWADMYAAAPADWAASVGLGSREIGGALVLSWATTARRYFSRAIGLGVGRPTTEAALSDIEAVSATLTTPAYEYFARLGFRRPYARTHYAGL